MRQELGAGNARRDYCPGENSYISMTHLVLDMKLFALNDPPRHQIVTDLQCQIVAVRVLLRVHNRPSWWYASRKQSSLLPPSQDFN